MTSSNEPGGYYYDVPEEQLRRFAALTPYERLKWLDDLRIFTLMARTPETAQRQERLRRGEIIIDQGGKR